MKKILIVGFLFLAGCGVQIKVVNRGIAPKISMPERPVLNAFTDEEKGKIKTYDPTIIGKVNDNTKLIHGRVVQLEKSIEKYNEYADKNNAEVRELLGLPDPEKKEKKSKVERPEIPEAGRTRAEIVREDK